jgi:hypothetical protein
LNKVLTSKASFVLLGLIEKGGRDYIITEIKKSGIKLEKVVAGEHYMKVISGVKNNIPSNKK